MVQIKTKRERVQFASDNVTGACPEVLEAIIKANDGDRTPYGNDQISTDLQNKFSEIFEKPVIVFPTASGTASNALALSTMTPSFGNIYCHRFSHINTDRPRPGQTHRYQAPRRHCRHPHRTGHRRSAATDG